MKYRHELLNDKWVIEYIYKGMRGGFFVEAGATNGINGSGTFILEKEFGWTGICVEAIDEQYEKLLQFRNCRSDNRCLSGESGKIVEFCYFPERSGHSGIPATFNPKNSHMVEIENLIIRQKKTVSLSDLLDEHDAPQIIDYLCLDIEGHELDVIEKLPFLNNRIILACSIEGQKCNDIMKNEYASVSNPYTGQKFDKYFIHKDIRKYRDVNLKNIINSSDV